MATSPQDARACYSSPVMMSDSGVRVVRRISKAQCQARLWTGRVFHVKRPRWHLFALVPSTVSGGLV
jgi:hypothetical protein